MVVLFLTQILLSIFSANAQGDETRISEFISSPNSVIRDLDISESSTALRSQGQGKATLVLSGRYPKQDWKLFNGDLEVLRTGDGLFVLQIPVEEGFNQIELKAAGPAGETEFQAIKITVLKTAPVLPGPEATPEVAQPQTPPPAKTPVAIESTATTESLPTDTVTAPEPTSEAEAKSAEPPPNWPKRFLFEPGFNTSIAEISGVGSATESPSVIQFGINLGLAYCPTYSLCAGVLSDLRFFNQYSDPTSTTGNLRGTRFNYVSPSIWFRHERFRLQADFQFLGEYTLDTASATGSEIKLVNPIGFRISGYYGKRLLKYFGLGINLGAFFEWVEFQNLEDSIAGQSNSGSQYWQAGLSIVLPLQIGREQWIESEYRIVE